MASTAKKAPRVARAPQVDAGGKPKKARASAKTKDQDGTPERIRYDEKGNRIVDGIRLINQLKVACIERGLPERHIADMLGVTSIYWTALCNGNRSITGLSKEKLRRLGDFLDLPTVQIMILADILNFEDFEVTVDADNEFHRMIEMMRKEPKWCAFAPTEQEWGALPMRMKMLIASLYEHVTHKRFLKGIEVEMPTN